MAVLVLIGGGFAGAAKSEFNIANRVDPEVLTFVFCKVTGYETWYRRHVD